MREEVLGMSASERDRTSSVRRHVGEGLSQREVSVVICSAMAR